MRILILVAVTLCLAGRASAQTFASTDPGPAAPSAGEADSATVTALAAILRGDYSRAAELLQPLVANWQYADPTAAFFLGLLYENGLGVPLDRTRACALFGRGSEGQGPFTQTAQELTRVHLDMAGPDPVPDCQMVMNWGLRTGFSPARFTLAPEHWVAVDISPRRQSIVAIVGYDGREKESAFVYGPAMGAIYLPTIVSSLPGTREGAASRHFIEVAHWLPEGPSQWRLSWSLAEIAEGEIVEVAKKTLTTIESDVPPFDVSIELRDLVSLQTTESGGVQIVVAGVSDDAREDVPTVAERKETEAETARRKAAESKVNWKRRRDPGRPPSFAYEGADGCGDLVVYGFSAGRAEAIAVRARRTALDLSLAPRTFDLSVPIAELEVVADVYEYPQREWYCSDLRTSEAQPSTWRAVGGTLTIRLAPPNPTRTQSSKAYQTIIQLENGEFLGPDGTTVRAPRPIRLTAIAGQPGHVEEPALLTSAP
jgi:hypothetical protein